VSGAISDVPPERLRIFHGTHRSNRRYLLKRLRRRLWARTMKETDSNFLRRQAEQCIALSRATFDLTLASRLRAMAVELHAKASDLEEEIEGFAPQVHYGNGGRAQDRRRG
jgi:hypothetical protein